MSNQNGLFKPVTKNGYRLEEVASALQKDIRRGNTDDALFWALEMFPNYAGYAWRRLSVIAVEDIESSNAIVQVDAMCQSFFRNNEKKKAEDFKNRIFLTKAVLTLCRETKSREADHAQFSVDNREWSGRMPRIPSYAFDIHTEQGRRQGKTKKDFIKDEQEGLEPKGRDDYYKKIVKE